MSTKLEKFDPSSLMEGVRSRIKATFVSLIPDDHWDELCKKEVNNFFCEKDRYRSDSRSFKSEFTEVCKEVLTEISKEKVKKFLLEYDSSVWANDGGLQASEKLKEMIIKMAPEIFGATFANMFQNAVSQMKRY